MMEILTAATVASVSRAIANWTSGVMDNAVGCYAYGNMFWCM